MSKRTKITVAAAGALLVAGTLAAALTPATAAHAAGVAASSIQGAGLHQDQHILKAADTKKKPVKKTTSKKKPAPKKK